MSGASIKVLTKLAQTIQSKTNTKLGFIAPGVELSTASYVDPILWNRFQRVSSSKCQFSPIFDSFRACLEEINLESQPYLNSHFQQYWQENLVAQRYVIMHQDFGPFHNN